MGISVIDWFLELTTLKFSHALHNMNMPSNILYTCSSIIYTRADDTLRLREVAQRS